MNRVVARASRPFDPRLTGETPVPLRLHPFRGSKREIPFGRILTPALSSLGGGGGDKWRRCEVAPAEIQLPKFNLHAGPIGAQSASNLMAWSKTKKAVVWGAVVVVLGSIATTLYLQWPNIANRMMVAEGERAVAKHIATPIDLNGRYAASAAAFENSAGFWGEMPWEFQVFRHVPLQLDGIIYLWGAGNAKGGNIYPEAVVDIPVNQKFDTLYVYHCTFYASAKDTPVYDLVFRYEDGESATNTIRYGVDTMDFNTSGGRALKGPSGPNTKVAWIGSSFTADGKHPLLFSLTGIKNPRAFVQVTSIDLFSSKNQSAGIIFGMTAGPAGLMR
jgi:hypothetical protein